MRRRRKGKKRKYFEHIFPINKFDTEESEENLRSYLIRSF